MTLLDRAIAFVLWFLACLAIDLLVLGILLESKHPGSTMAFGMVLALAASLALSWGFAVSIRPYAARQAIGCLFLGCLFFGLVAESIPV